PDLLLTCDLPYASLITYNDSLGALEDEVHVGVILDMTSWAGKIGHTSISMAISDFYSKHSHYKSRLVLHTKDSRGDPFCALSTGEFCIYVESPRIESHGDSWNVVGEVDSLKGALDLNFKCAAIKLMENINVQAILFGAQTSTEAKFLAELGMRAEVPTISFLPTSQAISLARYPHFVQFTEDETSTVKAITSLVEEFSWRSVILVYEDTDHGEELIPSMIGSFQDIDVRIAHRIAIKADSTDEQIAKQLHVAFTSQTGVFVVHLSTCLASLLFLNVKNLGMMSEGYVWIVTDKTMNFLHSMDSSIVEDMQGVLGFRPYISPSEELKNFTSRWRRKFLLENANVEGMLELNAYGVWSYDAISALAMAAERVRIRSASLISKAEEKGELDSGLQQVALHKKWTDQRKCIIHPLLLVTLAPLFGLEDLQPLKTSAAASVNKRLKIGVPLALFTELVNIARDPRTNATIVTGFCIDVFKAALEALDYEVQYDFIPFQTDSGQVAGSYSDLIDKVYYKKYDAVVGDTTITVNRSLRVDFTMPYTDMGYATVVGKTNCNDITICGSSCIPLLPDCGQPVKLSSNLSKFIVIVWVFVVLILTSSYTATLASMLTVKQIQSLSKGTSIGLLPGSILINKFINNLNFIDSTLKPYQSPHEFAKALTEGSKKGGVSAIAEEITYLKILLARYPNQFSMIDPKPYSNGFGFVFPKGSPLAADISREIKRMREEGTLKKLEEAWFVGDDQSYMSADGAKDDPAALSVRNFGGAFVISGTNTALATVLAIFILSFIFLKKKWNHFKSRWRHLLWEYSQSLR
ncbi:hypothetical protein Tsubulata_031914, partial [Turnera subulata]